MQDEADVGLVDAHAERGGGHHDVEPAVEELLVDAVPLALPSARRGRPSARRPRSASFAAYASVSLRVAA